LHRHPDTQRKTHLLQLHHDETSLLLEVLFEGNSLSSAINTVVFSETVSLNELAVGGVNTNSGKTMSYGLLGAVTMSAISKVVVNIFNIQC